MPTSQTSNASHMSQESIQTFLAFDYGLKNVGVAVGNTLTRLARPLLTISAVGDERWKKVGEVLKEWAPDAVIVGVPYHPDGAEHENTLRARKFMRQLQGRYGVKTFDVDERYTTTSAHSLGAVGKSADAMAAAIILQQFLESR